MGNRLGGKVAIVTGASSGIGYATALLFAAEGAKVVVGARRTAELDRLVTQITAQGGRAVALAGDVRDESYAKGLVDLAAQPGRLLEPQVARGVLHLVGEVLYQATELVAREIQRVAHRRAAPPAPPSPTTA